MLINPCSRMIICLLTVFLALTCKADQTIQSVLFTFPTHNVDITRPLTEQGIGIHHGNPQDVPKLLASGDYNVVVLNKGYETPAIREALQTFLARGGGVMVLQASRYHGKSISGTQEEDWLARQDFLAQYGASLPVARVVETDESQRVASMRCYLMPTTAIASPFNKNAKQVYLLGPQNYLATVPMTCVQTDDTWTAIVKGSPTTQAEPYQEEKLPHALPFVPKETVKSPTILAVRQVEAGRLAVFGFPPAWFFSPPLNCPPVHTLLGPDSDWIAVMTNTFEYLAQPSLAKGLGGKPTPQEVLNPPKKTWPKRELLVWADNESSDTSEPVKQTNMIIGARSNHAGGANTVKQWVAAAKAAGLDAIVFLDPLESTNQAAFDALKADCAAATNDEFWACPGLRGKDAYGQNQLYLYGDDTVFPEPRVLTENGDAFNNLGDPQKVRRTQFLFNYIYTQNKHKGIMGYFNRSLERMPFWEDKFHCAFALHATEHGKVIDNHRDDLVWMNSTRNGVLPVTINLMDSVDGLSSALASEWRTVGAMSPKTISKLVSQHIWWPGHYQYVTQGPRILKWEGKNFVAEPRGEWYRPDLWRTPAYLDVASDVGIKEIRVLSMGKTIYRFLPGGAKRFQQTIEFKASQQIDPLLIVTDIQGKEAISMALRHANTLWMEFICSDRNNYLAYGRQRTLDDMQHQVRPSGTSVTHSNGWWTGNVEPATSLTRDYPTLPVDGAPIGKATPTFAFYPDIATPGYPAMRIVNTKPMPVLGSPDVLIGGGTLEYIATDPSACGNTWGWWSPVAPNPFIEGRGINTMFNSWPDGLRAGWYEFDLKTRKDMPIDSNTSLAVSFVTTAFTTFVNTEGKHFEARDPALSRTGNFPRGTYITIKGEGGWVALISLDDNLKYTISGKGNIIHFGHSTSDKMLPADLAIKTKFGYLGAPAETSPDTFDRYFKFMAGDLASHAIKRGTIQSDGHTLHIDAHRASVELTTQALDLDSYLPTRIENLEPQWETWLIDRSLPAPNWRPLPMLEDTAYAALPCDVARTYFIGHPVICDQPAIKITISNPTPDSWQVTLHNPTDQPITTVSKVSQGWDMFEVSSTPVTLQPGTSVDLFK